MIVQVKRKSNLETFFYYVMGAWITGPLHDVDFTLDNFYKNYCDGLYGSYGCYETENFKRSHPYTGLDFMSYTYRII